MKHNIYLILSLLLILNFQQLTAQDLSLLILSEADGFPTTVLISNPGMVEKEVRLKLIAKRNGSLFAEKTDMLQLQKAQTRFRIKEYLQDIGYGQQSPEQSMSWELCAELYDPAAKYLTSSCQPMQVQAVLPPHLVYPFDKDELMTPLPTFSWTVPGPIMPPQPVYYSLKVVELQGYYPPKTAIRSLPGFYERENLGEQLHPYPPSGQQFQIGMEYAWQIHAYTAQGRDLGMSEIWTFSLKEDEDAEKETEKELTPTFVELKKNLGSGFYPAIGQVGFRFNRLYASEEIKINIFNHRHQQINIPQKGLERKGDDLFILDLPPGSGLTEGAYYILEVTNDRGETRRMRFRYHYP